MGNKRWSFVTFISSVGRTINKSAVCKSNENSGIWGCFCLQGDITVLLHTTFSKPHALKKAPAKGASINVFNLVKVNGCLHNFLPEGGSAGCGQVSFHRHTPVRHQRQYRGRWWLLLCLAVISFECNKWLCRPGWWG